MWGCIGEAKKPIIHFQQLNRRRKVHTSEITMHAKQRVPENTRTFEKQRLRSSDMVSPLPPNTQSLLTSGHN